MIKLKLNSLEEAEELIDVLNQAAIEFAAERITGHQRKEHLHHLQDAAEGFRIRLQQAIEDYQSAAEHPSDARPEDCSFQCTFCHIYYSDQALEEIVQDVLGYFRCTDCGSVLLPIQKHPLDHAYRCSCCHTSFTHVAIASLKYDQDSNPYCDQCNGMVIANINQDPHPTAEHPSYQCPGCATTFTRATIASLECGNLYCDQCNNKIVAKINSDMATAAVNAHAEALRYTPIAPTWACPICGRVSSLYPPRPITDEIKCGNCNTKMDPIYAEEPTP